MIRSTINYMVNDDGLPSSSMFTHPRAPTSTPDRQWVLRVRFAAREGADKFWWGWNKITESTGRQSSQSKLVSRLSDAGRRRSIVVDFHLYRLYFRAIKPFAEGSCDKRGLVIMRAQGSNLASSTMPRKLSPQATL